jgi:hypothetical protein
LVAKLQPGDEENGFWGGMGLSTLCLPQLFDCNGSIVVFTDQLEAGKVGDLVALGYLLLVGFFFFLCTELVIVDCLVFICLLVLCFLLGEC